MKMDDDLTDIDVSAAKPRALRSTTRALFLFIGFGLIAMEMITPPTIPVWQVLGYLLGAVLVLYTIVGLTPRLRVTNFGKVVDNRIFHVIFSAVLGLAIIILAMVRPPITMTWFAFFNLVGLLLVFDAIITSTWHAAAGLRK